MTNYLNVIAERRKRYSKFDTSQNHLSNESAAALDTHSKNELREKLFVRCPSCKKILQAEKLAQNNLVCCKCNFHMRMNSKERIKMIFDEGTVQLMNEGLRSCDPLEFPGYETKLSELQDTLDINEAVLTGSAKINDSLVYFGVMDFRFIMGSMGSVVGEKLTRMIEEATANKKPVIIFTASGGARMQEGMLSLYQMAKVVAALEKHNESGLLYISVLTDPTMGGVTASFALIADVIIGEPDSSVGFAGRRVIQKTIKEELPENFQKTEFLLKQGLIDMVCDRKNQKSTISNIIRLYCQQDHRLFGNSVMQDAGNKTLHEEKKCRETAQRTAWERVEIARNIGRPNYSDYIKGMLDDFIELHGDRKSGDDPAMVTGIGYLNKQPVILVANAKGKTLNENLSKNFGMVCPEGYRKVLKMLSHAEKFQLPVICLIDTPGAYCGIKAENKSQGEAIASCIKRFSRLGVPTISAIVGEGGSGGALAIGVTDWIYMLENSIYSVISPEGCSSILFKDSTDAKKVSEYLKMTSDELLKLKIIDEIILEPNGGAHEDVDAAVKAVKEKLWERLQKLMLVDKNELLEKRYQRFRSSGSFEKG